MSTKYRNSRDVPLDAIITRLNELSDAVTGGRESQGREFTMRIPAECDRDADLVIAEAAVRLVALQAENEALRARVAELESREDAMCDLSYANGAKQGFSLGQTNDNDGLENIVATRYSGGVKELKHLRTKANELEAGGGHD